MQNLPYNIRKFCVWREESFVCDVFSDSSDLLSNSKREQMTLISQECYII